MALQLVSEYDPILSQATPDFDFANPPTDPIKLVNEMYELMQSSNGIGLAAPQVGLPYRVFVMLGEEPLCFFNPVVTWTSPEQVPMEEGCLSFPGIGIELTRPAKLRARFFDQNGYGKAQIFEGLSARCFWHELDHLNGKTFLSYVSNFKSKYYLNKVKKFKERYVQ